jgi:hypothetical protein
MRRVPLSAWSGCAYSDSPATSSDSPALWATMARSINLDVLLGIALRVAQSVCPRVLRLVPNRNRKMFASQNFLLPPKAELGDYPECPLGGPPYHLALPYRCNEEGMAAEGQATQSMGRPAAHRRLLIDGAIEM